MTKKAWEDAVQRLGKNIPMVLETDSLYPAHLTLLMPTLVNLRNRTREERRRRALCDNNFV